VGYSLAASHLADPADDPQDRPEPTLAALVPGSCGVAAATAAAPAVIIVRHRIVRITAFGSPMAQRILRPRVVLPDRIDLD
jgi:hypothetical protein